VDLESVLKQRKVLKIATLHTLKQNLIFICPFCDFQSLSHSCPTGGALCDAVTKAKIQTGKGPCDV
jgi:hypothetical protein